MLISSQEVVSSQPMQDKALLPASADRLTRECVLMTNIKSLEAALEIEKAERERWEHLYKNLFINMHVQQTGEGSVLIPDESESEPDMKQEYKQSEKGEAYCRTIHELEKELDARKIELLELISLRDRDEMEINILNEKVFNEENRHSLMENEKNAARILELETILDESLKEMKNLRDENETLKLKVTEIERLELKTKCREDEGTTLNVNELQSNEEMLDAYKELIMGMGDFMSDFDMDIGVKRMGELDMSVITRLSYVRFGSRISFSHLQKSLQNPRTRLYHLQKCLPDLQIIEDGSEETLEDDESFLQHIREYWGHAFYNEVKKTIDELIEYNPVDRLPVPKLWNFKENRKATLNEAIHCIFQQLKELTKQANSCNSVDSQC